MGDLKWDGGSLQGLPAASALSGRGMLTTDLHSEDPCFGCFGGMEGAPAAYLLSKSHLQQAVGLIQHQGLQVLQAHRLGVSQVVNEAPLQPVAAPYWTAASSHMVLTALYTVISSVRALSPT